MNMTPVARFARLTLTALALALSPCLAWAADPDSLETRTFPLGSGVRFLMLGGSSAPIRGENATLLSFLQHEGVSFNGTPGSGLTSDGKAIRVRQTNSNLDKIGQILRRYGAMRPVVIETRFVEVNRAGLTEADFRPFGFKAASLSEPVAAAGESGMPPMPALTGTADLGQIFRAIAQKYGAELLGSPNLAAVSGGDTRIAMSQPIAPSSSGSPSDLSLGNVTLTDGLEVRYPQSYGEPRSQASQGGSVSVTPGTPQEFTVRNVGVDLSARNVDVTLFVHPTVADNGHSIRLELNPKVSELAGMAEIQGGRIVAARQTRPGEKTAPGGGWVPVTNVRQVAAHVSIEPGETLMFELPNEIVVGDGKMGVVGDLALLRQLSPAQAARMQGRMTLMFITAKPILNGNSPRPVSP